MSCNVKVFLRGFDLIRCDPGAVIDQRDGQTVLPAILSIHGVHLDYVDIQTQTSRSSHVAPGYNEGAEILAGGRPLLLAAKNRRGQITTTSVQIQKVFRPLLYIALQGGTMCLLNMAFDGSTTAISKANRTMEEQYGGVTDSSATIWLDAYTILAAVACFYSLQICVAIIGMGLVWVNRALFGAFDTTVDFLAGTPIAFLDTLVVFTPWMSIILWSWGVRISWASVYTNSLCSVYDPPQQNIYVLGETRPYSGLSWTLDPAALTSAPAVFWGTVPEYATAQSWVIRWPTSRWMKRFRQIVTKDQTASCLNHLCLGRQTPPMDDGIDAEQFGSLLW